MRIGAYNLNPHEAGLARALLGGEYAFWNARYAEILVRRPQIWGEIRKKHQSDKAADREYESTTDGMDEVGVRLTLKSIEKLMQGLGTLLKLSEMESKNLI